MAFLGIRRPPEWGVDPTPEKVRILRTFDLFVFWASLAVGLLVLVAGSLLILWFNLTLIEALGVALIGSIIGSLVLAGAGSFGARYGVPTMVSLRPILGTKGSWFPSALNVFQLVGWTSFELYIMGYAATVISGDFLGIWTIPFWIVVFSFVVLLLAIGGPLVVIRMWLEKVAIWLVVISTVVIAYVVFSNPIVWNVGAGGEKDFLLGIDLVIVMPVSWWPLISDYNRFARSSRDAATGTMLGYTAANFVFYFLGAALIVATGASNAIVAIGALGIGSWVLLLILVDEADNAFADVYSSSLSVQNISKKAKQLVVIMIATLVSVVVAFYLASLPEDVGGINGTYENFLFLIGALFVPLLGIILADFWLVRKGKYEIGEFYGGASSFKWRAFAAWIPGIVLYYMLSPSLVKIFWPGFTGLPYSIGASIPAFLLSALIYFILCKLSTCAKEPDPSRALIGKAKVDSDAELGNKARDYPLN